VVAIIKEALLVVWEKRLALFRALMVTGLVLATLDAVQNHVLKNLGWVSLLFLNVVLNGLVFTLFAVTCHRIVLLGETSVPKYGLLSWTSRETRFLGWGVVTFLYALLILGPVMLVVFVGTFTDIPFVKGYEKCWAFLGAVPVIYVLVRLGLLFPATAVGDRRNTDWAFHTTAKNGWRLMVATSLIPVSFGVVISALPIDHNLLTDFLVRLVGCAFTAIGIVALSLSFRFLSSESPGEVGVSPTSQPTASPTGSS